MGWDYTRGASRADIARLIHYSDKTIDTTQTGNIIWAVCQDNNGLCIVCFLLRKGQNGWGYKGIPEKHGPFYYNCPVEYLDMVPTVNFEWRAEVIKYHAAIK